MKPNGARQTYRVFDHVIVHITVSESTAHSLGLRLTLHAKPPAVKYSEGKATTGAAKAAPTDDGLKSRADAEMVEVSIFFPL